MDSLWWMLGLSAGAVVLAACGGAPGDPEGSYVTSHGVRIDTTDANWLPQDDAEAMEDRACEIARAYGINNPADALFGATVHLRNDPWACQPSGPDCYGSTNLEPALHPGSGSGLPEIELASAGFCPSFSYYIHELMHLISIRTGNGYDSAHTAAWWEDVNGARRDLYWRRCGIADL